MTLVDKIKQKLPSRNVALFWGGVLGLTGFYKYNKYQSKQRMDYYCKQAEEIANQPMGALDTPRKVHVYIAAPMGELGTRKARLHWEKYILPVFVAGALDYELTLVNQTEQLDNGEERAVRGGVHNKVAEEIKERRRRQLETDNKELQLWRQAREQRGKDNELRDIRNRQDSLEPLSLWKAEPYPGIMDIVAVGRQTWIEAVNGISDGAVGSLNYQMPPLSLSAAANHGVEENNQDVGNTIPPHVTIDYDRYDNNSHSEGRDKAENNQLTSTINEMLPAVAYIGHDNLAGWKNVPLRFFNFFHDQQNVDQFARQALQVVFESTKRSARGLQEIVDMGGQEEQEQAAWSDQQGEPLEVVVDSWVADSLEIYETQ